MIKVGEYQENSAVVWLGSSKPSQPPSSEYIIFPKNTYLSEKNNIIPSSD